jgi:uroporphyrinogen III methyltransferase/synthase
MTNSSGIVFIVGAGPGDIAYLTLQAAQVLRTAEVLVYDALVDARLLTHLPQECQIVAVGKRGGQPSISQTEINQQLVAYCQQGKRVVRLKSGDPFIFGRVTSEIQALRQADCTVAVVPGLSSALAAPGLSGIPLTDPVLSRGFTVISAHDPTVLNWQVLAQLETLVILMGGQALPEIVHQLQRYDRSPQTPIAIIRWCSHLHQQIWVGTLADILEQTWGQSLSPAVIVIGAVVGLRPYFQSVTLTNLTVGWELIPQLWDDGQNVLTQQNAVVTASVSAHAPLRGQTILVTRSAEQSSQFSRQLQQQGATVIEMAALVIKPPSSWVELDQAIAQLDRFDWVILTSTNGVEYFFERLKVHGKDARSLAGIKLAVVGEKTALCLQQRHLQPDLIPPDFLADSLVTHFPEPIAGTTILFPRVETGGRDVLVKELTARGAVVTEVAAYQSDCPDLPAPEVVTALREHRVNVVTFASSKTVRCFCQLLGGQVTPLLAGVVIASIGPQTSQTCQELLGRVDLEAKPYTLEGLTTAIVDWLKNTQ